MNHLITIAVAALVIYLAIMAGMFLFQRKLLYHPDTVRSDLSDAGLEGARAVDLVTSDGLTLNAWYAPPAEQGGAVILYTHGNAGTLIDRAERMRHYLAAGIGFLLVDYRGFGGNPGSPTEEGLYADGRAGYDWLLDAGHAPQSIVLYGESMGSAVATRLASERDAAAIVLDAPFTSIVDVAAGRYPWLPVSLLVVDRFDSLSRIGGIRIPLLVLHGTDDRVVPFGLGQRLYEAANEPKRFVRFDGGAHMDLYDHGAASEVIGFVREHVGG
jgi:hypothetical protein